MTKIGMLLGGTGLELVEETHGAAAGAEKRSLAEEEAFAALVRRRYEEAPAPLNLSTLSSEVVRVLPGAKSSEWFGYGTFRKALDQLSFLDVRFAQHHFWDERRHQPPTPPPPPVEATADGVPVSEPEPLTPERM